nr:iron ABC transporter permease [Corynebacterium gerontici]
MLVLLITLVGLLIASFLASLSFGSVDVSRGAVLDVVLARLRNDVVEDAALDTVIWQLRAPRGLLAMLVGAGLALSGIIMQTLVRNPLADPYLLGVASGASVGATAVLTFGLLGSFGVYALSGGAFIGALIATASVYLITNLQGGFHPLRLILTGVVMSSAFSALASFLVFKGPDPRAAQSVMFWLLGSVSGATFPKLLIPLCALLIAFAFMLALHRYCDAIMVGPDMAATVGVNVELLRRALFFFQALLVGTMVAVAGGIGFVGLVVPHVGRLLVGSLHLRLMPVAMLCGALFLLWVDVLARIAAAPQEIPLGVVTGAIGAPLFLLLMGRGALRFSGGHQ